MKLPAATLVSPTGDKNGLALNVSLLPLSPASRVSPSDSAEVAVEAVLSPSASLFQPASIAPSAATIQEGSRVMSKGGH